MNAYKLLELWIVIIAFIAYKFRVKGISNYALEDRSKGRGYIILTAIPIILVTGLRGNMGTDYLNYEYIYKFVVSEKSLLQIIQEKGEVGFALLQKVVGELSNYNTIFFMIVLAVIVVFCYYYIFYKYSLSLWLSVLMLLVVGGYYSSFNTTRQFVAGALFFLASVFIYNRNLIGYIIAVLLIASIHTSAIVMLPFYWLLDINWKSKKQVITSAIIFIGGIFVLFNLERIVPILGSIFYSQYIENEYMIESVYNGISLLIRPFFFVFFIILNGKVLDLNNRIERCCFNGMLFFVFCYIASYQIYIVYRFTYYFLPFVMLLIPNIIYKTENKRQMNLLLIASFLLLYFIFGQAGLEYEFCWQ